VHKDGAPATDRAKVGDPPAFLTEEARLGLEEGLRDAGLCAAPVVLGQGPPFPERQSQAAPESPPQQQPGPAQRPGDAFLTEEALLRLEEGLRAQREQQAGRRFSEPDAASSRPGAQALGKAKKRTAEVSTQIDAISEKPPLAPGADHSDVRTDEITQALHRVDDCAAELIRSCSKRRRGLESFDPLGRVYPRRVIIYECCGHRLAAIRIDRGLTRPQLAAALDMSRQAIARWEHSAIFEIRSDNARRLARTLRCRRDELLAPADAPLPPLPPNWPRIRGRILQQAAVTGRPQRWARVPMIALRP
jgi:transcriptional regulator with XRE-family HTH domain